MSAIESAIVSACADALEAAGIAPVYERRLSAVDGSEGVVVRIGPQGVLTQYIDGRAEVRQPLRVLCKRKAASKAMSDAEGAWDAMDGLVVSAGGVTACIEASGTPFELSIDDSAYSIWEADATASYMTTKS